MTAKPMSEEELAAIRRRHYVDDGVRSEYDDAALLLAEVDRLRDELDAAHEAINSACDDGNRNADIGMALEKKIDRLNTELLEVTATADRLQEGLLIAIEALESIDLSYVDNKRIAILALEKIRGWQVTFPGTEDGIIWSSERSDGGAVKIKTWSSEMTDKETADLAYWERNMLALHYAQGWYNDDLPLNQHPIGWTSDQRLPHYSGWRRVLSLENGAITFHIPDDFDVGNLKQIEPNWDGHTTEEKWRRIAERVGVEP